MNIPFLHKKNTRPNKKSAFREKGRGTSIFSNREIDWRILLVVFFGALILGSSLTFFVWYRDDGEQSDLLLDPVVTLDRSALGDVLEELRDQDFLFRELERTPPTIQDPSL